MFSYTKILFFIRVRFVISTKKIKGDSKKVINSFSFIFNYYLIIKSRSMCDNIVKGKSNIEKQIKYCHFCHFLQFLIYGGYLLNMHQLSQPCKNN